MAIGNTFGATVLSSYGGFWISAGITFTPGGFNIMSALEEADGGSPGMFYNSFGIMLFVSSMLTFFSKLYDQTDLWYLGLVHLHHIDAHINYEINYRILRSIPCCRHCSSPHVDWVCAAGLNGPAQQEAPQGWRFLCYPYRFFGLV